MNKAKGSSMEQERCLRRTSASSFPASFLYALVQRTLRGFRFILKFLWHLLRQNRNTCTKAVAFLGARALTQ